MRTVCRLQTFTKRRVERGTKAPRSQPARNGLHQPFLSSISSIVRYSGANPDAIQFLGPPSSIVPFLEVANASCLGAAPRCAVQCVGS